MSRAALGRCTLIDTRLPLPVPPSRFPANGRAPIFEQMTSRFRANFTLFELSSGYRHKAILIRKPNQGGWFPWRFFHLPACTALPVEWQHPHYLSNLFSPGRTLLQSQSRTIPRHPGYVIALQRNDPALACWREEKIFVRVIHQHETNVELHEIGYVQYQ